MRLIKLNKEDLMDLNAPDCRHPNMELAECVEAGRVWKREGHEEAVKHLVISAHLLPLPEVTDER